MSVPNIYVKSTQGFSDSGGALSVETASKSLTRRLKQQLETDGEDQAVARKWTWIHQDKCKNTGGSEWVHSGLAALTAEDKTNNRAFGSYQARKEQHQMQSPDKVLQAKWLHEEVTVMLMF